MLTAAEEANGRLRGLLNLVRSGQGSTAAFLAPELGTLAGDIDNSEEAALLVAEAAATVTERGALEEGGESLAEYLEEALARFEQLLLEVKEAFDAAPSEPKEETLPEVDYSLLSAFVQESREHLEAAEPCLLKLEEDPSAKDDLDAVFRAFHTLKGGAGFCGLIAIGRVAHEAETLLDLARQGKALLQGEAMELSLRSVDVLKSQIDAAAELTPQDGNLRMSPEAAALQAHLRNAVEAIRTGKQPVSQVVESRGGDAEPAGRTATSTAAGETVRVDRDRLDSLINLIGELVIAESMVAAEAVKEGMSNENSTQLNKITRELQELSLSLRMMPVQGLFQKMARLVRDLSKKLDKPVRFIAEGGETEVDKSVLDQVADPLLHIVRNAVDHGIETVTSDRGEAGKDETATVTLRAFHRGGCIHIEVCDDGRGLDHERILKKAIEQGLVAPDASLTHDQINRLIFHPGFSTAAQLTDVSGRGVGMDVVIRNVEALRGSVAIQTKKGEGTKITLSLPLTLAIIDGIIAKIGGQRYIFPTLAIREQLHPSAVNIQTTPTGDQVMLVRGRTLALHSSHDLFGVHRSFDMDFEESSTGNQGIIIIVEDGSNLAGVLVDEVIGQQQVVIKSLGEIVGEVPGVAGGAVLPDGHIGLIVDVGGMLALA
jgi:two-component system, chemotaxis family, sensor kinase CheA